MKDLLLGLVGPLIRPIAKLLAKGAVKLVLLTKTTDDDQLLKELAAEITAAMAALPPSE